MSAGQLDAIYVPEMNMEHVRSLIRKRSRLVRDQTRCKNRLWHLLMFSGLKLEEEQHACRWSKRFIDSIKRLPYKSEPLKQAVEIAIEEYLLIRKLIEDTTNNIRKISKEKPYVEIQKLLQSIPEALGAITRQKWPNLSRLVF